MRRLRLGLAILGWFALVAPTVAGATTTTTVGQLFPPTANCTSSSTYVQTGVAGGNSYTVPFDGFIVSWSFMDGATLVSNLELKVARPAGGGAFKIIGQSFAGTQALNGVNSYPVEIQVAAGDLIGIHAGPGGDCLAPGTSADTNAYASGDVPLGTTTSFSADSGARFPVAAQLAPPCTVPKLKGKSLKAARKRLRKANCALGKARGRGRKVKKQSAKPGTVFPPGGQVNVRLG